jgi:hypothetical protein
MLFAGEAAADDHRYFKNLGKTEFRPDIATWCEETYARAEGMLDPDFPVRFRRETPQRISELLFAAAFLDAGWEPLGRVHGFDLAFRLGEGRLLVEVTTPDPHSPDTWREERGPGHTLWATDEKTEDAALRRLTSGFFEKSKRVRALGDAGVISDSDYVVIAISGFRLQQETPRAPEIGGPVPDFAKAFVPIGSQYLTFQVCAEDSVPTDSGWEFNASIEQNGKTSIPRDAFLRPDFQHIHAVAYTPLLFGEPITPIKECAALHNPMARPKDKATRLGLGLEYAIEIADDGFSIGPL